MHTSFVNELSINENNSNSNCYHLLSFCHVSDTVLSNSHVLFLIIKYSKEPGTVEWLLFPILCVETEG